MVIIGNKDDYHDKAVPQLSCIEEFLVKEQGVYFYHIEPGKLRSRMNPAGEASFAYVETGIQWALQKKIHALVAAPISKEKWLNAGIAAAGHTGLLAETAGVKDYSMFFWSKDLKVVLFSIHIPLKDIFSRIKKDEICRFIRFTDFHLTRLFQEKFTFLISGLNPHAGENGYLGDEECGEIIPALSALKSEIDIQGPYPPDVVFLKAKEMSNTVVVAWYHDQGLIPFKLLNIHNGVNLTLGLPYIRTSPDHGTAYDIAGKGIANPSSMIEAIRLAGHLLNPVERG